MPAKPKYRYDESTRRMVAISKPTKPKSPPGRDAPPKSKTPRKKKP